VKYKVQITPTAESELCRAFEYIHRRVPLNAARWLKGIYKAIDSLEQFPTRCGAAREAQYLNADLRQFIFKSHRIIFAVDEKTRMVRILYVRHGSMRAVGEPDEEGRRRYDI
jgi:plasmid stabilization system protein ParE